VKVTVIAHPEFYPEIKGSGQTSKELSVFHDHGGAE
jgi:hypothetical protein